MVASLNKIIGWKLGYTTIIAKNSVLLQTIIITFDKVLVVVVSDIVTGGVLLDNTNGLTLVYLVGLEPCKIWEQFHPIYANDYDDQTWQLASPFCGLETTFTHGSRV